MVSTDNQLEVEFTPTVPGNYYFQWTSTLSTKLPVQFNVIVDHVNVFNLIGARVKRGPDWYCGDIDGGDGKLGTILKLGRLPIGYDCIVKWDATNAWCHRWGTKNVYELELVLA